MRILLISQFVVPSEVAGATRGWKLVRELARRGHTTDLITGAGHYLELDYRPPAHEQRDGVNVTRVRTHRRFRQSFVARLSSYTTFAYGAVRAGLSQPRPDVVIASIQPIFTGVAGLLIAKVRGATLILEVRDAWPESAVAVGALRNPILVRACRGLASWLYHAATLVVVVSPGLRDLVRGYGVPAGDVIVLPNGVDDELFDEPSHRRDEIRATNNWSDKYVVMYTGAHVLTARLQDLLAAAALEPEAHFVFVGDGDRKSELIALAKELHLRNVQFLPACSNREVPDYLAAADAVAMCLHAGEHWSLFFQNKFFDYLGSGRPIVAAVIGDQRHVVDIAKCGLCPPPEDPKAIADAVRWLRTHPAEATAMGSRGREWGLQNLRRSTFLKSFADLAESKGRSNRTHVSAVRPDRSETVAGYRGYRETE